MNDNYAQFGATHPSVSELANSIFIYPCSVLSIPIELDVAFMHHGHD